MAQPVQVGLPAPDRETSPILDDAAAFADEPLDGNDVCVFNGITYRIGTAVLSGTELLRCEPPGVWVRRSP